MVCKGLGLHLFVLGFHHFGMEGSFKGFLSDSLRGLEEKLTPVYRGVRVTTRFVYNNRFAFLTSFSAIGIASYMFNFRTPSNVPLIKEVAEIVVVAPVKVEIPESKWSPKNTYVLYGFECVRGATSGASYMFTNLVGSNAVAAREGALDATVSPENKIVIEKAVNEIIPVLVDKIKDSVNPKN